MSAAERVGDLAIDGVEPGAVYLLRSSVGGHSCYEARDLLHVMSRYRGGEVRGYERPAGSSEPWRVRLPAYEGHWPEVDRAVATLTGERVVGCDGEDVGPLPGPQALPESRRVARLEGSLQVADQVACSALERAGIATPAEGYRRAGWSRLGDGIEQLRDQRDRARAHVARLYARITDRQEPTDEEAERALYEEAVAALEEELRTAWWAQVQRRKTREGEP